MTDTPSTGDVIGQMSRYLENTPDDDTVWVSKTDLQGWLDCVIEAAARLDPDNPPLTEEDFKRMRRKEPRR